MGLVTMKIGDVDAGVSDNATGWIPRLLNRLFNHKYIVNCDRDCYLRRWYVIRTEKFGLFVHQFVRSDEDRALHDHPWNFIVIPIWRGYIEHSDIECPSCLGRGGFPSRFFDADLVCPRCLGSGRKYQARRIWPIISARFRPAEYRHRVELLSCDGDCIYTRMFNGKDWSGCPKCEGCGVKPAWSIFIRFKSFRGWGFWDKVFIPWNQWWQDKCD
jgi:hypothetical protein